ncbi:MAG: PAS domain S-box protein, partial [Syntrophomonadaceae bacterium]
KRAELALRESEARARAVAENIRDSLVVLRAVRAHGGEIADWQYLDANEGACTLLGMTRESLVGHTLREVLPARSAAAEGRLARVLATGDAERYDAEYRDRALLITTFRIDPGTVGVAAIDITDRKRAEDALRSERDFSTAVLDTIASLIVVLDSDGRIVRFNRACERATGYLAREVIGKKVLDLFVPADDLPGVQETFRQIRMGQFPNQHQNRWRMKDGSERLLEWANTAIPDASGAVRFIIGTGFDITDRERAVAALRASEAKLRLAKDAANMGSWEWDLAAGELTWSVRCKALFGLPPETAMSYDVFKASIHPEDRGRVEADVQAALAGAGAYDTEMRVPFADGSVRWIASRGRAFFDARGSAVRMAGIALDITDRKRREANQAVLAAIADDFARLSTEDEITRAIGARLASHLAISTCTVADLADGVATLRSAFTRPGAVEAARTLKVSEYLDEELQRAARAGQTLVIRDTRTDPRVDARRYEELGVRAGVIVPFLVGGDWRRSFAVGTPEGRDWREDEIQLLQEVASRFFPRIERARAEEALSRANERLIEADRHKTEFLGVLSHELRNPLAPIRNSIFLLEQLPAESVQAARARQVIRRQTEHLARLVDDLLDVTRISRGKIQLQREVVDLRNVVRRTCEDHRAIFEESAIELNLDFPVAPVWADVDPTRIAQVVGNLLANSGKFTPSRGAVTVRVRGGDGHAVICVRDTGIGMDPAQIARMFEPFAQEDRTLARTRGGLGLGLALSKGLIELHGGTIAARSAGPGEGSEFTIMLPLAAAADDPTIPAADAHRAGARRRVLIIEDNTDAARTLADVLEIVGHEVIIARDGTSGIALAHELKPDVVICDLGLPDVDGYEVARTLRQDESLRATR